MLKNYFKIAWRNLFRNKVYSIINICGLAVGITTCLLITLYILDESSFDKQHKDGNRIFRIASSSSGKDKTETWAASAAPLAGAITTALPEVEQATRLLTFPDIATMLLKYNHDGIQKSFFETQGYYVDSNFFQLFTYQFIHGNANVALSEPNSIVVSEQLSEKFFGKENPVGKAIIVNTPFGEFNYTVKAVFDSRHHKSHIPANYFLSMRNNDMWNWVQRQKSLSNNNIFFTYVKLKPNTATKPFEKKLNDFFEHEAGAEIKAAGFSKNLFIQPMKDIYLRSAIGNEIAANGNITYLYILGCIGAFILLIACVNFMNLSTARSQKRAKEVGVRKVIGAEKKMLIWQFLGESFLMSLLSLCLALVISNMLLPVFNMLTQKDLHAFDHPSIIYWIGGLALLTGLAAGIYPAFYLSSFKPASVLKGKPGNSYTASFIRKFLVVFQFTVSICLILGAIVIWQQLDLLKNKELGFNKEQKLVLPLQQAYRNSEKDFTLLKNELSKNQAITSITSGSAYPGKTNLNDMLFYGENKTINDVVDVHLATVNNDYIENLGFKLLSGRAFSKDFRADSTSIILNETAAKELGYTVQNAPGKMIQSSFNGIRPMQIIGVVQDFNFESLHNDIKPFGFTSIYFGNKYGFAIASIKANNYTQLISQVEKTWTTLYPGVPFVYSFLDQDFQRNYQKEQHSSTIIVSFTIIAIVIACLGLFGLAAFSAEQRTKEIGIRKVLGASVTNVAYLLSGDFLKLVLIAIIIASPIAWLCMNKWLEDFAYKVHISWWMFGIAGGLAITIALVTVSFQSIKAALANPVKSLRSE
ncbi:MAG: ABC transporter permease [Chitinophagaceae bacterium]